MTRTPVRKVRAGTTLVLFGAVCALSAAAAATSQASGDKSMAPAPDFSGVWQVTRYERSIRTVEGKLPPLQPAAKQLYEQNIVARKQLRPQSDMSRCVPPGTPRVMWAPLPMMILQTARKITFIHEYQHLLRHIYLDEALPAAADLDPTYMGESVGRWDGDTLVVETLGVNGKTTLDREGMPHSESMRVTERLRLIDNGKRLEDLVRIDDPQTFTTPWTARVVFERKPDVELKEYNCVLKYEEF